ncbi:MAG: metal ABC transporter permease [Candidatus Omnitrophica bacterium]|nr:metal ABC transporter permease [Candidatus Omnitrophota bacterium]
MTLPFLTCLILAGIYTYLGLHVIEREVIFVDLALAQIAALGASIALMIGVSIDSGCSYWISLGFAVIGAAIFSLTRLRIQRIPQEAIIGITYAVSAALLILVLSRSGEGDEHIKQALVGNILLIAPNEAWRVLIISSAVGIFHFLYRNKFLMISQNPEAASRKGINIKLFDFLFYVSLGLVVTSSVRIAGVLLIFTFLIVPAACAMLFSNTIKTRLMWGWVIGFLASVLGLVASYCMDLPTGASIVCAFGLMLIASSLIKIFLRN